MIRYDQFGILTLSADAAKAVVGADLTVYLSGGNLGDSNLCPSVVAPMNPDVRVNITCGRSSATGDTDPSGTNAACRPDAAGLNPVCFFNFTC